MRHPAYLELLGFANFIVFYKKVNLPCPIEMNSNHVPGEVLTKFLPENMILMKEADKFLSVRKEIYIKDPELETKSFLPQGPVKRIKELPNNDLASFVCSLINEANHFDLVGLTCFHF
jgi:hypothetical protein